LTTTKKRNFLRWIQKFLQPDSRSLRNRLTPLMLHVASVP